MIYRPLGGLLALAMMAGCASITEGTSQQITINTEPQGASCEVLREGQPIAKIDKTPKTITVDKTKHDLRVVCSKEGYTDTSRFNNSGVEGMTVANAIAGGLIGWAIDSATGADNEYEDSVLIVLEPNVTPEAYGVPESAPTPTPEIDPSDPNYGNPDAVPQS